MEDTDVPVVDNEPDEPASGFCAYCGHVILPPEPPQEPEREPF